MIICEPMARFGRGNKLVQKYPEQKQMHFHAV